MHSMSKLSTIAAAASLLAALPAFGAASDPSGLKLVDLTLPDGTVTSSKDGFVVGPETAFNDGATVTTSSDSVNFPGNAFDIVYQFNEPTIVNAYGIYNFNDGKTDKQTVSPAQAPRTWTFWGSQDGETWTLLDRQRWESGWAKGQFRCYLTGNRAAYEYYKIDITDNNGNKNTRFARLEFYNVDTTPIVDYFALGQMKCTSSANSIVAGIAFDTAPFADVVDVKLQVGQTADSLDDEIAATFDNKEATATITGLSPLDVRYFKFVATAKNGSGTTTLESDVMEYGARSVSYVAPGAARSYMTPDSWSTGLVPDRYWIDVVVDGDTSQDAVLNATTGGMDVTNGVLTITGGDSVNFQIPANYGSGTTMNWHCTTITNYGVFSSNAKNKNNQNFNFTASMAPFFNHDDAKIIFNNPSWPTGNSYMNLALDGSVNNGLISLTSEGKQYGYLGLRFQGGGEFANNGTIRLATTGTYNSNKPGSTTLSFGSGDSCISGTGSIVMDMSGRAADGTQNTGINGNGTNLACSYTVCNDVGHSIIGEGFISGLKLLNKGLIKSHGDRAQLKITLPYWGYSSKVTPERPSVTNAPTGRVIADSAKGVRFVPQWWASNKYEDKAGFNGRFVNLGLLESRAGSAIEFANGVNTTSATTSSSDLALTAAYLELWGTIAGGGEIRSNRAIYIGDGAILAPGDRTDDTWSAQSTCGTLTFMSNVVMRANCTNEFQFAKADKFDSLHVGGTLKIDGTLKIVGRPHGGTFRMITSDNPITSDNEKFFAAIDLSAAEGGSKPRLRYDHETKNVTVETVETDPDTGNPITETVEKTIYYIEATFGDGFYVKIR